MKKLYSFLSVLAVAALGVNAAPTLHKTATFTPKHQLKAAEIEAVATAHKLPEVKNVHRISAPAADVCDMYDIEFISFDETGKDVAQYTGSITVNEFVDGLLEVVGFIGDYPIYGEYNEETGVLALEPDDLDTIKFQDGTVATVAFDVLSFDSEGYFIQPDIATYNLTFNGEGFDVPQDCFLGIIAKDPETEESLGVLDFYYNLTITSAPWENAGTGVFVDGIFGRWTQDGSLEYEIDVHQLATDPTQIRLYNYFADYGGKGSLYLDITDPERIVMPYQESGITLWAEVGEFYLASVSALYDQNGNPAPTLEGQRIINTNNVIDFEAKSIYFQAPKATDEEIDVNSFYIFGTPTASKLTLPTDFNAGIGNVNAATTDKVEYFNLQGIRIENPTHGLYIRRAGKKVEKVIL